MFFRNPEINFGKVDPRARKCMFVGYASSQKGNKCFDPKTKKLFVTMDILFFEHQPFFRSHLQGENEGEDSNVDLNYGSLGSSRRSAPDFSGNSEDYMNLANKKSPHLTQIFSS